MELTFLENDGKWIAEFKVDKEFNLHIEREDGTGKIKMYQNSATGGKYAIVEDFAINNNYKPVLDFSSGYFVGEKSIKIVSEVLPTYAAITTDGDVVEIKSQAKSIEITSNGTTSVEPDAGFSYLSKVDVKVDVPTSGGGESGGESGGSGSDMIYMDASKLESNAIPTIIMFATDAVYSPVGSDSLMYGPAAVAVVLSQQYPEKVKRISFNRSQPFYWPGSEFSTCKNIGEVLELMGLSPETASDLFITKEEFYNLNA